MSNMIVYVFHDEDHGTIKVFKEINDAMKLGWGDDYEPGWRVAYVDKKTKRPIEWRMGEYCAIYEKEVE